MTVRPYLVNGRVAHRRRDLRGEEPVRRSARGRDRHPDRRRRRGGDRRPPPPRSRSRSTCRSRRARPRSTTSPNGSRRRSRRTPQLIAAEGGKPLKWARVEAARAVSTFRWASETIRHGDDELMRLDTEAAFGSRIGLLRRFPIGPVLGITPFNFPLNLVAHKVAPALAVGAPIVVKPASATPIGVAAPRGVLRRDRPAQGHVPGAAGELEGRRRHGARRPVPQDQLHRLGGDRLVPQGPRPEEAA